MTNLNSEAILAFLSYVCGREKKLHMCSLTWRDLVMGWRHPLQGSNFLLLF
jgi:hypothetical protein